MTKQELLKKAKQDYEKVIEFIEVATEFLKPIEKMIPKGWIIQLDKHEIWPIQISKGHWGIKEKMPIDEFRLVCNLFETACREKISRDVSVSQTTNEFNCIEAYHFFQLKDIELSFKIIIYNPDYKCEIKWEEHISMRPIVDDTCLGLQVIP